MNGFETSQELVQRVPGKPLVAIMVLRSKLTVKGVENGNRVFPGIQGQHRHSSASWRIDCCSFGVVWKGLRQNALLKEDCAVTSLTDVAPFIVSISHNGKGTHMTVVTKTIHLLLGDITMLHVSAIVNSANKSLLGGAGVDRAIHRAAGRGLWEECLTLDGCSVGESRLTKGYNLPAKFVIHTVGPVWLGGWDGEDKKLASSYRSSLDIALAHGFQSVAFPCISRGVHRYPIERAADIAIATVKAHPYAGTVIFCCHKKEDYFAYAARLHEKAIERITANERPSATDHDSS